MRPAASEGMAQRPLPQRFATYELRITARCCRDDLGLEPGEASFEELQSKWKIVRKFIDLRSSLPDGQETFRGALGSDVFTLHAGRQRGATWYDREYRVVWLLGFGTHREGDHSDSYAHLERLDKRDQLMPSEEDYEALIVDREAQLLPTMVAEMRALLSGARATPGKVHSALLASGVAVSLYVYRVVEDDGGLEEFHLAVSGKHLETRWLSVIRTALWPEDPNASWEYTREFPVERPGAERELCFRHSHDLPPAAGEDGGANRNG